MLDGMSFSRRFRRWVAGGMMIAVLFTQLAVAAYSCPTAPLADPMAMAVEMPECHGMGDSADPAHPQLCKAHCSNDAQSAARPLLPDFQPNPAAAGRHPAHHL